VGMPRSQALSRGLLAHRVPLKKRNWPLNQTCTSQLQTPLRVGFEEFAEESGGVFAKKAIVRAEGGEEVGVDVEFTSDPAVNENGDDDFGFGFEGAGEISGIAADVVDNDGLASAGSCATDALVERDTGVRRHGALEGAEDEDVAISLFFEHVEANPVVLGKPGMKQRDDVAHQGFGGSGGDGEAIELEDKVRRFRF